MPAKSTTENQIPSSASATTAIASPSQVEPCPLLELPPELRILIYGYLTPARTLDFILIKGVLYKDSYWYKDLMLQKPQNILALLRTCKCIHNEALPILYDQTTVEFLCHERVSTLEADDTLFRELADFGCAQYVSRVSVDLWRADGQTWESLYAALMLVINLFHHFSKVKHLHLNIGEQSATWNEAVVRVIDALKSILPAGKVVCDLLAASNGREQELFYALVDALETKDIRVEVVEESEESEDEESEDEGSEEGK